MQSVDYMQGVSQDARYLKLMVVLTTLAQGQQIFAGRIFPRSPDAVL